MMFSTFADRDRHSKCFFLVALLKYKGKNSFKQSYVSLL